MKTLLEECRLYHLKLCITNVLLQILDSVARMAILGFETSYREAVILLVRSYIDQLPTVDSTHNRTLAPEASTERIEVD